MASSEPKLVARYRRLQSWYRETELGVPPGPSTGGGIVGSSLAKGLDPALNFLTPAAYQHAQERMVAVQNEGGTLAPDRLVRNMLSSMPLCFNIFGSLRTMEGFAELLAVTIDPEASSVTDTVCEWAPPKAEHLNDRSAFDAIVRYETAAGEQRFLGVETKYTETFSPRKYENERYQPLTETCGWFVPEAFNALSASPAKQLWRTVMLAASYTKSSGAQGRAVVLSLAEDTKAAAAVQQVKEQLTHPARLVHVTLERLVQAASSNGDPAVVDWAERFQHRYLRPERADA